MKKALLLSLLAILIPVLTFAQDIIYKRNGDEIVSKVIEISPDLIKYKKMDSTDGPIISVYKTDVIRIKYANGHEDIFDQSEPKVSKQDNLVNEQVMADYIKGENDARRYYHRYTAAGTVTLISTLLIVAAGLVPAIVCSSVTPSINNLGIPNEKMLKNRAYMQGYRYKAKKIKSTKVWTNFAIGAIIILGLYAVTHK